MGIKFIKLDEASRSNLDVIMNDAHGGEGKPPGEPPIIVETHGADGEEAEAPPQPIAPVRPQSVPKGAKRTIIGMGPGPRGASGAPEAPAAAAAPGEDAGDAAAGGEPAEAVEAAAPEAPRAGDFLADISSAIDNALGTSDSSPPPEAAPAAEAPAAAAAPESAAPAAEAPAAEAAPPIEAPTAPETKEEPKKEEPKKEPPAAAPAAPIQIPSPAKEKPAEPQVVRIGAEAKTRRGVSPIVWVLLVLIAAGAVYYFAVYAPEQEQAERQVADDATAEPPKPEPPKPEPPKPEPPKPEPPPPPAGKIEIVTKPAGAAVAVDGVARDGVTPLAIDGLEPQKEIAVEARLFGWIPASQKVVPGEGEPLEVELKLAPAKVEIEFKTDPPGAQVMSGEKWLCKTPRKLPQKGMTSDLQYTITKPGYQDAAGTVALSDFTFADGVYRALVEVALAKIEKPAAPPKPDAAKPEPPKPEPPKPDAAKPEPPKPEPPKPEPPKPEPPKPEPPKPEPPKPEPPKPEPPKPEPPKPGGDIEEDPYG
jgi:hypothetical protein